MIGGRDRLQAVAGPAGQHPQLAAALSDRPAGPPAAREAPLFDRAMTRILTGLLP